MSSYIFFVVVQASLMYEIRKHKNWVRALLVLQNGSLVSSSFDKSICVWNTENGGCIKKIENLPTLTCAFSNLNNGDFASATGSYIYIWNGEDYSFKFKFPAHDKTIWCLKTLPNGDLISGGSDRKIKTWNYFEIQEETILDE